MSDIKKESIKDQPIPVSLEGNKEILNQMENGVCQISYNKNEINLIYKGNNEEEIIFGEEFVNNNKDKIELKINGENNNLIEKYILKEGDNI